MVMSDPRATMPEDAKVVEIHEAHEHGYWGQVPDTEDNHRYTVAGVIAAAKAGVKPGDDKPYSSAPKSGTEAKGSKS